MLFIIIAAILGAGCAIAFDLYIPAFLSSYAAVVIIAAFDSVMGAYKSLLADRFDAWVFVSGFFGNSVLAALMVLVGKRIDLDLYIAVLVVFTYRIFSNFSFIRRFYLKKIKKKLKKC